MMVKESEAAEMWCPYGRTIGINGQPHNRYGTLSEVPVTMCLGPKCMKWEPHIDLPGNDTQFGACGA